MNIIRRKTVVEPTPSRAALWLRFWRNALGIPLAVLAAAGIIAGALWLSGGDMPWQAVSGMGTALFWTLAICLMYPALLVLWVVELRDGLRKVGK